MPRRIRVIVVAASLPILVASCSGSADPAEPSVSRPPTAAPSSNDEIPGEGVPGVDIPLDISHFQQAPCDVLTQAEVDRFLGPGISPRPEPDARGGPACIWQRPGDTQAGINLGFPTAGTGLTGIYRNPAIFRFIEPQEPIQSYPAVAYGIIDERMTRGRCTVAVGTSDRTTVDVGLSIGEARIGKQDPCTGAYEIAEAAIGNIKGSR